MGPETTPISQNMQGTTLKNADRIGESVAPRTTPLACQTLTLMQASPWPRHPHASPSPGRRRPWERLNRRRGKCGFQLCPAFVGILLSHRTLMLFNNSTFDSSLTVLKFLQLNAKPHELGERETSLSRRRQAGTQNTRPGF